MAQILRSFSWRWKIAALVVGLLLLMGFLCFVPQENGIFRNINIAIQPEHHTVTPAKYVVTQAPAGRTTTRKILLLDPYKVEDANSVCSPLIIAKNREPICVYPTSDDAFISKSVNNNAVWEGDAVKHLITLMSRDLGLGFIDVGVNVGIYTLTMASYGRDVVGIEPYRPNLRHLAKSLRLSPQFIPLVKIIPLATSDKDEIMHFWARAKHPGGTQLHPAEDGAKLADPSHLEVPEMSVGTIRLDDMLEVIKFDRAILKIDIEGGEYKALMGASKLFAAINIPYVFMEWDNKCKFPNQRAFFIKFFRDRNYTVHRSTPELEELELSETGCTTWPFDVIFVKS